MRHHHLELSLMDRPVVVAFARLEDARVAYDGYVRSGVSGTPPRVVPCAGCDRIPVTAEQAAVRE